MSANKLLLIYFGLWAAIILAASSCHAQTVDVSQFNGLDVGTKLTNAQNLGCSNDTNVTCLLVLKPELGVFPPGSRPSRCSRCNWLDWTNGQYNGQSIAGGGGGGGTVTSVGLGLPAIFSVSGSPVTTSGTLTGSLATQSANLFFAGPSSGGAVAPTFRILASADFPSAVVPNAALANSSITLNTTAPLSGGASPALGGSATISCPNCATTANGGALSGTAPVTVSAGGAIGCATCQLIGPVLTTTPITVNDGASPYPVAATDVVLRCNGSTGNITLDLPPATGTGRFLYVTNRSTVATKTCIITPSGTDTIDTLNSPLIIKRDMLAVELQDTASGKWDVLQQQVTYNNFGVGIFGSADVTIGNNTKGVAPTLTAVAAAAPVAGTYQVAYTLTNSLGATGSATPVCQSITTSGGNLGIQVTSPGAQTGMGNYNVYATQAGASCTNANLFKQTASAVALGTNTTINAAINTGLGTFPTTNTADTQVGQATFLVPNISNEGLDMTINGQIVLENTGTANVMGVAKVSTWSNNNTVTTCAIPTMVMGTTTAGMTPAYTVVPVNCAGFGGVGVPSGSTKTGNIYFAAPVGTITAKFQNDLVDQPAQPATNFNVIQNETF